MKEILFAKRSENAYDPLTDGLAQTSVYSDRSVVFPSFEGAKPNDGVKPEWFYPVFDGANSISEYSATIMYTRQQDKFENVGTLLMGIALVEMKHIGKLSDFITAIGGQINNVYSTEDIRLGATEQEAIEIAIQSENGTITFYNKLLIKLNEVKTPTAEIAIQLVSKLRADEQIHLKYLEEQAATYE